MAHEGTGHDQHLLLAAGEGAGNLLAAFLQPGEIVKYHFQVLRRHGLVDIGAHFQILLDSHLQENPASLGNMGQAVAEELIGIGMGDILAAEFDGAAAGVHQAGNGLQNRTLAGAVGTDQCHDFTLVDMEGDTLDGVDRAVVDMDIINFQHGFSHQSSSFLPRYASITAGFSRISSGVPLAMIRP